MPTAAHTDPLALRRIPDSVRHWLYTLIWLPPTAMATVFTATLADRWHIAFWNGGTPIAIVASVLVVSLVTLSIAWVMARTLRRHALRLEAGTLRISTGFYRKQVPLTALDLGKARSLDLDEHPQLKPLLKTNGMRLPGYAGGHFRLRNWQKAFCAIADRGRVLYLPTRDGSAIVLGCAQPEAALRALRETADV